MDKSNKPSYNLQLLARQLITSATTLLKIEQEMLRKFTPNANLTAQKEFRDLRLTYKNMFLAAKELNEFVIPIVKQIDRDV